MYSLLIVDDEPAIVEGLAEMLHAYDLPLKRLKLAYSAKEAIDLFRQSPFDIVISDIKMPEMDGIELLGTIRGIWKDTKFIFLTGYSDFHYAQQAIKLGAADYLLKPADDDDVVDCIKKTAVLLEREFDRLLEMNALHRKLNGILPGIQRNFFQDAITYGLPAGPSAVEKQFQELKLRLNANQTVSTVIVRIDEPGDKFLQGDLGLIQFSVQNVLNEILGENNAVTFRYAEGMIVALIQAGGDTEADNNSFYLHKCLEEMLDTLYRVLGVTVSLAVNEGIDWKQWPQAFKYLLASLKQSFGNGLTIRADYANVEYKGDELENLLPEIVGSLKNRDRENFEKCLDHICRLIEKRESQEKGGLALLYLELSRTMLNFSIEYNITQALDPLTLERLTNLYTFRNVKEMKSFLSGLSEFIINKVRELDSNPCEEQVKRVRRYIQNNIAEDLSLDSLAKKFRMNPSYLSRVFHKAAGEQLSSFITNTKMEAAKRLLMNESIKIYEISQQVGYETPNYFSKVFRKVVGVSPQDYRNIKLSDSYGNSENQ